MWQVFKWERKQWMGSLIMKHSRHTKAEIVVFKVEKVAKAKKLAK
jgi:hypothetical protein